jgi:hypothetical protein
MMRFSTTAGMVLTVLMTMIGAATAADAPYEGTWKLVFMPPGQEQTLAIFKVTAETAGPKFDVVATAPNLQCTIEPGKSTKDALHFTVVLPGPGLRLSCAAYPPKGEKEPKELRGSLDLRGNRFLVRYERTEDKQIDAKGASKMAAGAQDFGKAMRTADAKEKLAALSEFVKKNPQGALALQAQMEIAGALAASGAKEGDVHGAAEAALSASAEYGPEMRQSALAQVAQKLTASKKAPALAVAYARQVEKALPENATATQQVAALKTLLSALKQTDQQADIKTVGERLAKLEKVLDAEYLKDAVPFPTRSLQRDGTGTRVALVELFTGAQCPPCVAADVAFDAALKTYQPQDVVLLQYHLHIPGPDALTNDDTEKRSKYYPLRGVPSTYVGGGDDLGLGGPKANGKASFQQLTKALNASLAKDAGAMLALNAKQSGDDIIIMAEVTNVKGAGKDTRLRVALVEEMVRYPGTNGQRFHHHVVRAMPGGPDGIALKDGKHREELKVNLTELRRTLAEYLDKANQRRPFLDDARPLDLAHLMVVAFVQNDDTKEVLQAAQVEVHGKR